ncbi:MAG: hypothetical protein HZA78_01725 [Candidatus Schekmanbacteria bacterium]|nr:hypothetical protein [Candidatus Schekmanbacteria bacterium]
MNQLNFRIDLLQPGKNIGTPKGLGALSGKLSFVQGFFLKQLYRKISASFTLLIICFILVIAGNWIFYKKIYQKREITLQANSKEIAELQQQVNDLNAKIKQKEDLAAARRKRFEQLKSIKSVHITWRDKLAGIRSAVIDKLWLSSFIVNDQASPVNVSLKGSTLTGGVTDKPLRGVADFINNIMANPIWYKNFSLKNWNLSTSNASSAEGEVVEFQLELEAK